MKKTRITNKIVYVQPESMTNFSSCAGMMVNSKKMVWVDMNMGALSTKALLQEEKPEVCMITHYHLDHSVWIRYAVDNTDAKVFIPKNEESYLTCLSYVIENTAGIYDMAEPWQDFAVNTLGYRALKSYACYDDQTVLSETIPEIIFIETPGHSPGHTSFYFPDEKILFSGDMGLDRFGPWYGWADCRILDIVDSILRLDGLDVNLVLTSHGGILKRKEIRSAWQASIRHLVSREDKIIRELEKGRTSQEIVDQGMFYPHKKKIKEPIRSFLHMWDAAMFNHHEAVIKDGGLFSFFPEIRNWKN